MEMKKIEDERGVHGAGRRANR
ncbi:hypothetical protein CCACVL1_30114 [Corchorus capsularis]|uniref:Uncharacterized protein n=1 Tax=Corchorus capsularis TaxID=210143 RepID=A0A1R3FYN2_COCAP|nr:hypothetical protein CCACVL1_30114 [Corchorus capsularis]